jgi:hypothetical protein
MNPTFVAVNSVSMLAVFLGLLPILATKGNLFYNAPDGYESLYMVGRIAVFTSFSCAILGCVIGMACYG